VSDWMLSVIIPVHNEEAVVETTWKRLRTVLSGISQLELIFVDDGSSDHSRSLLRDLAARDPQTKVLAFSRNFGHENAVSAGLQWCRGDAAVVIDADLQDPPELILEFVHLWQVGYDVVYGIRRQRSGESWVKRLTSRWFYRVLNYLSEVPIPLDVGDFRLMSRRVINTINAMPEGRRFVRGMVAWVGFKQVGIPFDRAPRSGGQSKYSLGRLWRLSWDAITGFSTVPVRMGSRLGMLLGTAGILWAIHIVVKKLLYPQSAIIGWSSIMSVILTLGGLQLILLGILGEYVGRILEQVRGRPLYIIDELTNIEGAERVVTWPSAAGRPTAAGEDHR
jgi:glycosyltransferase involved in cell wall biosynthesis